MKIMIDKELRKRAKEFTKTWLSRDGYERGETAAFWRSLLHEVFEISNLDSYIEFEKRIKHNKASKMRGYIDAYIPSTKVLIEQKGKNVDLQKAYQQSDKSVLTPYQQAKRYADELPNSLRPRWIIVCNFQTFYIHDLEHPDEEPQIIQLEDLPKEYYRLGFLVDSEQENIKAQKVLSFQAGDIVGRLYDRLLKQYKDPTDVNSLKSLNKLCVRLVFCLYAEDAGLFATRNQFHDYFSEFKTPYLRRNALIELFRVLNTKIKERSPYLDEKLCAFPYVNGGLFADEQIEIPLITDEISDLIISEGSENFDWSKISPTIFGSLFESTLNPITRSKGGMHYTSVENIHKVIDPLFLNDLREELHGIKTKNQSVLKRLQSLVEFQNKISKLKFLDPACGSGNFLTETYICLRRLENEVISLISDGQEYFGDLSFSPIKVNISQFYGIELNDFAVSVAQTALWIAESQMRQETEEIIKLKDDFLPLKSHNHIVEANALRIDWSSIVPNTELTYIISNPPFVGASKLSATQKAEIVDLFEHAKLSASLDYVSGWYIKVAQYINGTKIKAALVSTNSITQGEQVAPLWTPLIERYQIKINFAHQTFRWDSEADDKAHVFVVIISISQQQEKSYLYTYENPDSAAIKIAAKNISPYLRDERTVIVKSLGKAKFSPYSLTTGNKATDDQQFQLTPKEKDTLIKQTPELKPYIRPYIGARDFLHNTEITRYCLWLKDAPLSVLAKNKEVMRRLDHIKTFRENSSAKPTQAKAEKPNEFFSNPQKEKPYLLIPRASSENRPYIPMCFMGGDTIASDAVSIITNASEYLYGILTSRVHMTWMRAVGGRLEGRYRYSGIVFDTFVFPPETPETYNCITETAKNIIKVWQKHTDCSPDQLYKLMPKDLLDAHRENDRQVMLAYGFDPELSEDELRDRLFDLYEKKLSELTTKKKKHKSKIS